MMDLDSETLFNTAAAALTTVAVLFFLFNVQFPYSPLTKVLLALAFLAGIVAISQRTDDRRLTFLSYAVVLISIVGIFINLVNTFDVNSGLTVAGLLVLAAVLFLLRTRFDADNHLLTANQATALVGVVSVIVAVVLITDVVTGGLAYELQTEPRIEFSEQSYDEPQLGTMIVSNPTPLPERVETPNYAACAAGNWDDYRRPSGPAGEERRPVRANLHIQDGYNEHVLGFSAKQYPVRVYLDATNVTGETFPVERTEACPDDDTGSPYIAIFEGSTDSRRYAV